MLEKSQIKDLVEEFKETIIDEHLFEGVYKWAENRASKNQKLNINLNLNERIKEELTEILPLIKFEKMNTIFLIKFVVKKSFLFPGDQLSDLLWKGKKTFVKITDKNGKIMKGEIQCDNDERVATDIQSVKDKPANRLYADYYFWSIKGTRPSTPSKLSENAKIKWYLLYDKEDDIAVRSYERVWYRDYLLAEMFAEDDFTLSTHCKIEVFCSN
uniref:Uncharacterized protein n=1 Tax=Panagrolaimus sp. PS1159 TaxID=55785 RepID=A0AC35FFR4_9BILA